ncbi:MAG: holo-ACP synthase [Nitrospirae bacterium]|nr:holo-ACP synthase [Nitrospirota bacterium]
MIFGIGIDLVKIERIKRAVEKWHDHFVGRVFTKKEQEYSFRQSNPYQHLSVRLAAKEAILKAIGTGWSGGIKWTDIEIINNEKGSPVAVVSGRVKDLIELQGVKEILISLSHDTEYAIAQAVLTGEKV